MPIDWNWISLLTTEIKTSILESSTQHLAPMVQSRSCRSFWPLAVLLFLAAHFHPAAGKMESFDGKMEVYTAPGDDKQLTASQGLDLPSDLHRRSVTSRGPRVAYSSDMFYREGIPLEHIVMESPLTDRWYQFLNELLLVNHQGKFYRMSYQN